MNNNLERAFFVLDVSSGVIHIFKTLEQDKPSESFSISNGTFPEKLSKKHSLFLSRNFYHTIIGLISDPETGKVLDSFEFRTANNL